MREDFPFYAEHNLKILNKAGGVVPFKLNRAQNFIHSIIETQKKDIGKVRALVLKARQQGCSTYTAGRYYHAVTHRMGVNGYVLSHAMDTTEKLFMITRRMHDKSDPIFRPDTRAASAKELAFSGLDSTFMVGTAGAKETGRGGTIQYFHGSEVAFWPNAETHFAGVMQSIPTGSLASGTEIILESTANGPTGRYHEMCMDAQKGEGEYVIIFTPWYWQEEYKDIPPVGWDWMQQNDYEENKEAVEKYGLSKEQVYWMHLKRKELTWDWLFKQEYPTTIEEAFQSPGDTSLIPLHVLQEALGEHENITFPVNEARIGALDPAGATMNADRTGIGHRVGRVFENLEYLKGKDTVELAKVSKEYIYKWHLDRLFIDVQGLGVGVYDILKNENRELAKIIRPCNFASSAVDLNPDATRMYDRMRDQCWGRMHKWFLDGPVQIPNMAELRYDLTAPGYTRDKGYLKLESKRDMRTRGIKSPDGGDVLAMTFTEKVRPSGLLKTKHSDSLVPDYDILGLGLWPEKNL